MLFTYTYTIILIQSHILRLQMGSTTFNINLLARSLGLDDEVTQLLLKRLAPN